MQLTAHFELIIYSYKNLIAIYSLLSLGRIVDKGMCITARLKRNRMGTNNRGTLNEKKANRSMQLCQTIQR